MEFVTSVVVTSEERNGFPIAGPSLLARQAGVEKGSKGRNNAIKWIGDCVIAIEKQLIK